MPAGATAACEEAPTQMSDTAAAATDGGTSPRGGERTSSTTRGEVGVWCGPCKSREQYGRRDKMGFHMDPPGLSRAHRSRRFRRVPSTGGAELENHVKVRRQLFLEERQGPQRSVCAHARTSEL